MVRSQPTGTNKSLLRYWLTTSRDHDGNLSAQSIRIEWDGKTATGDLVGSSIRWQNVTDDVPAVLATLAAECAVDAYEHGVAGCDYEGQETANDMWIAVDEAHTRQVRERNRRKMRAPKGSDESRNGEAQ
jgi:hypothetical protein